MLFWLSGPVATRSFKGPVCFQHLHLLCERCDHLSSIFHSKEMETLILIVSNLHFKISCFCESLLTEQEAWTLSGRDSPKATIKLVNKLPPFCTRTQWNLKSSSQHRRTNFSKYDAKLFIVLVTFVFSLFDTLVRLDSTRRFHPITKVI